MIMRGMDSSRAPQGQMVALGWIGKELRREPDGKPGGHVYLETNKVSIVIT